VVVSDDSTPDHAPSVAAIADRFACRYLPGPQRGLYANRNAAALACTGTHIRTMDDDHTFPADHFSRCEAAVRTDPARIWSTGEIVYADGALHSTSPRANQLDATGLGTLAPADDEHWAIADGSTIYPADVFRAGHRMVETWSYGSAYLEFGAYLHAQGWRFASVPDAPVEHHLTLSAFARCTPEPTLFAALCFTRYFQPSTYRTLRVCARHTLVPGRSWIPPHRARQIAAMASARWQPLTDQPPN
jgi:glycosyltransferase involved in cell wall biosynthesis